MQKIVVKSTFVEVEDICGCSDDEQPLLRSQTTTDLSRLRCDEMPVSEGQAEYVSDGTSWEKTGKLARTRRRLLSRCSEESDETHVFQARTESTCASCTSSELPEAVVVPATESATATTAYPTDEDLPRDFGSCASLTSMEEDTLAHIGEPTDLNQCSEQHLGKKMDQRAAGHRDEQTARGAPQQRVFGMQPPIMMAAWSYPAAMVPWQMTQVYPRGCMPSFPGFEQLAPPACGGAEHQRQERRVATEPASASLGSDGCRQKTDTSSPERTTLMLRNIPRDYSRTKLTTLLDSQGFAGRYDFVYLPYDFKTQSGLGFAFVNLQNHKDAEQMWQRLTGFSSWETPSSKACVVGWSSSDQQGLQANVERYRNSSVMHESVPEECKPLMLVNGVPVPFPHPTRKVCLPHEHRGSRARKA
mmetsp:Transcript_111932/g.281704  ORF Transcript_111932/g.281704 Transcript_111932/m.281704 type:complete len:416 (+) Transcript_111932:77-1324(+)